MSHHSAYKGKTKKPRNRVYKEKERQDKYDLIDEIKFHHKKGNYDTALVLIDDYLSMHPTGVYVEIYRAMTLFKAGKKEESIKGFEKIINQGSMSNSNEIFAMTQYAYVLSQADNNEDAIYYYEKVIDGSKELPFL